MQVTNENGQVQRPVALPAPSYKLELRLEGGNIVVISGNPSPNIADIMIVSLVFKDGVGYDSANSIASVHSTVRKIATNWVSVVAWTVIVASVSFLLFRRSRGAR
jgi:hypothetical protein